MWNYKISITAIAIIAILYFVSCKKETDAPYSLTYNPTEYPLDYRGLTPPVIPVDNPLTVQGVQLGRMLFYDKRLSGDGTMSCSSCHSQATGFSDTNRFSIGILGLPGGRQAMATTNMLWNSNKFFWDGRANLLRDQSLMPIEDSLEMHETLPNVVEKLQSSEIYPIQFFTAFGSSIITTENISKALEQFMNSIVTNNSRFDKEERGEVTFTPSERRGKKLFFTEYNAFFPDSSGADCAHCHSGANFENDRYMNNGLDSDADMNDLGRMGVTGNPMGKGKFKVTSLRNIELTPPYMHDGSLNSLLEVVEHYNSGGKNHINKDSLIKPLNLSYSEKLKLVRFLKTLTDENYKP
ncbi:MAG: cytochrome-c peroxidase [Flavobacteriales bacterium]